MKRFAVLTAFSLLAPFTNGAEQNPNQAQEQQLLALVKEVQAQQLATFPQ